MRNYTSYHFFNLHCMLWNRNNNRLSKLGYLPIFLALKYIQYSNTYELVKKYYCDEISDVPEEDINISYDSITGISLSYVNDILFEKVAF